MTSGAGVFITTVVTATIILIKPFKIDIYSTIRDLVFFIIALAWILMIFLYSHQVYIWQPVGYLVLYALYIFTVIIGHQLHQRKKKRQRDVNVNVISKSHSSKHESLFSGSNVQPVVPKICVISEVMEKLHDPNVEQHHLRRPSSMIDNKQSIIPAIIVDKFLSNDSTEQEGTSDDQIPQEFVVSHNHVYTGDEARSRATTLVPPPAKIVSIQTFFYDIYEHLRPLSSDVDKLGWFSKTLSIVKIPAMFLFKLTIPLNECSWSKAVAIMQAFFAPQWFLFSVQMSFVEPFNGSPGLYVYALFVSLIIAGLLMFFTSMTKQPRYYKELSSYLGFAMSLSWIYFISSEVVNVVTMFGVVLQLSHEILGLTILAWSNSIGDLIADISVVRQGYPRMAMAAAIGGPLFNLLIGFGIPFLIAKTNGRTITIDLNPTCKILILFLGISLSTNLVAIFAQRFHLRRPHAFVLIFIYSFFIVFIILTETDIVVWN